MRVDYLTFVLGISLVGGQALSSVAERERDRRRALRAERPPTRVFTDADLDAHRTASPAAPTQRAHAPRSRSSRNLAKEERYWRKETRAHERDIARLDQRIRQLESRLRALPTASKSHTRSVRDRASRALLEDALDALAADKAQLEARFRERARKGGAFPGWLR